MIAYYEAEGDPELSDEDREFYTIGGFARFVDEHTSPVRDATIGDLLVERSYHEVGARLAGTYDIASGEHTLGAEDAEALLGMLTSLQPADDPGVKTIIFFGSGNGNHPLHIGDRLRINGMADLQRGGGSTKFAVRCEEATSRAGLRDQVAVEGFSLPTEDEWEYLCGGGSRTLFRWGNSLVESDTWYSAGSDPNLLEVPNRQGLRIAYDQFQCEVVDAPVGVKGGDGGYSMHDGIGTLPMLFPLATFFRPDDGTRQDDNLSGGYHFYRRIIRLT
jgi:hypothetical protein